MYVEQKSNGSKTPPSSSDRRPGRSRSKKSCKSHDRTTCGDNEKKPTKIRKQGKRYKVNSRNISKKKTMMSTTRSHHLLLLVLLLVLVACATAFAPSPSSTVSRRNRNVMNNIGQQQHSLLLGTQFATTSTTTSLAMAKKRRRRKDAAPGDSSSSPAPAEPAASSDVDDDGLPDFDLSEEIDATTGGGGSGSDLPDFDLIEEVAEANKPKRRKISTNPDEITDAMRGTADAPVRSVSELLQDRQLEKAMVFDESEVNTDIPDFTELAKKSMSGTTGAGGIPMEGMGKKKAKQAARKAAAIEAKALEEEEGASITDALKNIPGITNDSGDVALNKVRFTLYICGYILFTKRRTESKSMTLHPNRFLLSFSPFLCT